ncbi:MAG TPA: penicillin-binding transpeptidase domain-containing protein [Chitinivibrionales bacterium]|nr:penicillin-binding transpeptidase domain-containing protein [Chitinivibrionales bacterium]
MMKRIGRAGRAGGLPFFKTPPRIPKKGRIRFFLAIILFAVAIKIFIAREPSEKSSPSRFTHREPPRSETAAPAAAKPAPRAERKQGQSFFGQFALFNPGFSGRNFSASDLAEFFKRHPPRFNAVCDTVTAGKKSYVLHYSFDTTVMRCSQALLKQYHPKYGAVVALEPATGRVLALVSYTREAEPSLGDNLFARSLYPAASVFKTVTAAAAIEKGNMEPESKLPLAGRRYTLYRFQLKEDLAAYAPVSLTDAYSYSINPVFGRIGVYVLGPAVIREYFEKFGFNSRIPFELDNETPVAAISDKDSAIAVAEIASGFNQKTKMSPLFGALIAAAVSQKGRMPVPYFVDSVTTGDSCLVYRASPRLWRAPVRESTALKLHDMMERVARYGTARTSFRYVKHTAYFDDIDYGGKTGSVDDDKLGKVDWFVGFAAHPTDPRQRIAVGIVTVHDQFWTVHSAYIGAEVFRKYIRQLQKEEQAASKVDIITGDLKKAPG